MTISTVGLGQDVNRALPRKGRRGRQGQVVLPQRPEGLEQILLHDVLEHTGSTAMEKPLPPRW